MSGVVLFRPGNELLWLFRREGWLLKRHQKQSSICHQVLFQKRTSH
jgi:hypothetical protein